MNDDSPPDTPVSDMHELKAIASRLTDEDFQRDQPPAELWTAIANAMGRPVNEVVTLRRPHRGAWLGAAAVLVVGLAIGVGLLRSSVGGGDVVASTALSNEGLSPLGAETSGNAEVIQQGESYRLHLELSSSS